MLVLILGDPHPRIDDAIRALREAGFVPVIAANEDHAVRLLEESSAELAILIGADAVAGDVLGALEQIGVPAVVVAGAAVRDAVAGMRSLAVLLTHDASAQEIVTAATAALPRRRKLDEPATLECGLLVLDLHHSGVWVEGSPVSLPPKQFQILKELALENGRPVASEDLRTRAWPTDATITTDDVHRHVYRLRRSLGDQARAEPLIVTRRGFGYAIRREPAVSPSSP